MNRTRILHAFNFIKGDFNLDLQLKEQQIQLITAVLSNKDATGFLPTGFGKSMCYILPPLILDEIYPQKKHTVLVISALLSLMRDQTQTLLSKGISSAYLTAEADMDETVLRDVESAEFSVIYASPEMATKIKWIKIFRNDKWQSRICLLAIDECHCVSEWGESFRPEYRQLSILRSVLNVPCIALTATVTTRIKNDVIKYLNLDEEHISIAVIPDRPNIYLDFRKSTHHHEIGLMWVVNYLKNNLKKSKKMIIYCRSIRNILEVYMFLLNELKEDGIVKRGSEVFSLVEMFHSSTSEIAKNTILTEFKQNDSRIRCLVASVAFGMGIDISDLEVIIHWGAPKSILSYWQEVGRAARDGRDGTAVMFPYGYSLNVSRTDSSVKDLCTGGE